MCGRKRVPVVYWRQAEARGTEIGTDCPFRCVHSSLWRGRRGRWGREPTDLLAHDPGSNPGPPINRKLADHRAFREGDGAAWWLWVADGDPTSRRTDYRAAGAAARMLATRWPHRESIEAALTAPIDPMEVTRMFEERAARYPVSAGCGLAFRGAAGSTR